MKTIFAHIPKDIFCIMGWLIFSLNIFAQEHNIKTYSVKDGLPGTRTYAAYQDHYGYLWIASPSGLSRFDGRQFVNYSLTDGLPTLNCIKIFQDSHDRLWVGTVAGMVQFKNNRFISYPSSDHLNNFFVFNFMETGGGRIWALTDKGVYEFSDTVWKNVHLYAGFDHHECRDIVEKDGELYVNYASDIICRSKDGRWELLASQKNYNSIFNVMTLQDQQILVSTSHNIYEIRNGGLIPLFYKDLKANSYFSYQVDSKKRLWVAGDGNLKISRPGDWRHFSDSVINQSGITFNIKEDESHNTWMGTAEGLLRIKEISFKGIDKNNGTKLDGIYNIIPLPANKLLFSSGTRYGLLKYSGSCCQQLPPPRHAGNENYFKDPVDAYTFDSKDRLWLVTRFKRLLHYNGKSLEDFSSALPLTTTENIYDFQFIKKRDKFFICADSTLLYGTPAKFSLFIPRNTGVPIVKPTRVLGLNNGLILLYIDGKGIFCIDRSDDLRSFITETGFDGSNKGIQLGVGFYEDGNHNFWVSVPGLGLYEYGFTATLHLFLKNHLTVNNGLQGNHVISLISDTSGRIWVATNTGIDILQPTPGGKWDVFNYAKVEDLSISESDFAKLACDAGGNVWLSTPSRIIKFYSGEIKLHKETPRIIIEKVQLAFKETDWSALTDSLYSYFQLPFNPRLKYNQNSLGIFFNAIDLSTSNSSPEYSYKLLPLENQWSIPSKTKSVSFAQLPPGNYQFIVRAKDRASGWSQPALFRFAIIPPYWNSWWFRLLVIAVASLIIIGIFRARIRKIRQDSYVQNQLKELEMKALKAQMNPHFIYNALNSIQALIANDKRDDAVHYIGSFSRLLRQVLENSENNVIGLDKELETMELYIQLETLRLDMQLEFEKIVPDTIVTEFEKIPPLILQPFVENALWHGLSLKKGKKKITVTLNTKDDWLIFYIADNGIGREKAGEWKARSVLSHPSKAIEITWQRLIDFNENTLVPPIEILDLYNEQGISAGTRVTVYIKRKRGFQSA